MKLTDPLISAGFFAQTMGMDPNIVRSLSKNQRTQRKLLFFVFVFQIEVSKLISVKYPRNDAFSGMKKAIL